MGALLHDIGRFVYPPPGRDNGVRHGLAGADILRNEGVDEEVALICERHVGIGLTASDIEVQKLPLPKKDYVPLSPEEKIVAYADNLAIGNVEGTEKMVEQRFSMEIGPEYGERVRKFHEMVHKMMAR